MHHWYKAVDEGQSVRSVFVDFAKAFDHVDHNILVAKQWTLLCQILGYNPVDKFILVSSASTC